MLDVCFLCICSLLVVLVDFFFFFKQKTAYEMRISDWSSDVCSSDLLELAGDPFGTGEDLESHVVAAMEPALQSRVLRLTTDQDAAEDPDFRLALVFNPQGGGELFAFCASQPEGGAAADPPPERIELRTGFCRGDDLLAAVDGWVEAVSGPEDARFEQLLHQVVHDLFARRAQDD